MRCYLKGELRHRFCLAWLMVPDEYQERLRAFLRSVRAVPSIEGTVVRLADGSRTTFRQGGDAVLSCDTTASPPRGWLLIREEYGRGPEPLVVGALLHELAHAFFAIEDGLRAAIVPQERGEAAAWFMAASWAAHGCLDYEHGFELVLHALDGAVRELDDWIASP